MCHVFGLQLIAEGLYHEETVGCSNKCIVLYVKCYKCMLGYSK